MPLPPAPRHPVGPDGRARFGAFEGSCESTSLLAAIPLPEARPEPAASISPVRVLRDLRAEGRSRLARAAWQLREKRWVWFGIADGRLALSGAILHLGYLGAMFFWVLDREERRLALDGTATVPPFLVTIGDRPGEGLSARARTHRGHLGIDWRHGLVEIRGHVLGAELSVALATSTRPVTAVCPVGGGRGGVNVTQKATCLPVSGTVRWGGKVRTLDHALGSLDYTHGLLPRETSWRWASCWGRGSSGKTVGVNLVAGFNDGLENAVWIDGRPCPVGPASFVHEAARPGAPWRVTTVDGLVDLSLRVEAVRREDVDVGVAAVRFAQVFGTWSGRVGDQEVRGLAGVAEDHESRW